MGHYLNPGNAGFETIRKNTYIDKSELIELINSTIGTLQKLTCISRPRRFGKSCTAKMLCAYYDRSCHSESLFDDLKIAEEKDYKKYLNQFDVIYIDLTEFLTTSEKSHVVQNITEKVTAELNEAYPQIPKRKDFLDSLLSAVEITGRPFIFIIDEWDAMFREDEYDQNLQKEYILLLRSLFKNSGVTDKIVAAAYITGILPIKKYGTQSAISDFEEFTMVKPRRFAPYVGFTEDEVRKICQKFNMDFEEMRDWYDGYFFKNAGHIYNPNSVMKAVNNREFDSYWSSSETYESLRYYIDIDFDGLQKDIVRMLGGVSVPVSTTAFQNDMTSIKDKDDVLTLLTHLGYLAYDDASETVRIPNDEVRIQFVDAVRHSSHEQTSRLISESDELFQDTLEGNEEKVAEGIERFHELYSTPLFYNNEQALRSVIRIAYLSCINHYLRIEEMPAGKGFADMVFIPRKNDTYPAMIIELKWDQDVQEAIDQIKQKDYKEALHGFEGDVLLVGISYDPKTKKHNCKIRKEKI